MRFALHKNFRYDDNNRTPAQYLEAVKQYYTYLDSVDFTKGKDILKYFGDSFFHEGGIKQFILDLKARQITMVIYRDSDREDLNNIRNQIRLPELSQEQYQEDPILYKCDFRGVKNLEASILFSRIWSENEIMDTETTFIRKDQKFLVSIGFWKNDELFFKCDRCDVQIVNIEKLYEMTNGTRQRMPYCNHCKSLMLTKDKIKARIQYVNNRTQGEERRRRKQR